MGNRNDTFSQIGKAGAIIVALTLVDKVLAVAKEMIVAQQFGVSADLDVFNVAYALPGIMMLFFSGAFISAFVPLYLEWSSKYSQEEADRSALSLFYLSSGFFALLALMSSTLAPVLFPLFGYGFSTHQKDLGIVLLRFLMLLILLDGAGLIFRGLLHGKKEFFHLYLAPTFINLAIIFCVILGADYGIYTLVAGFLVGTLARTIYMGVAVGWGGFRYCRRVALDKGKLAVFLGLALPLLGSELIANSNLLVDQVMATQLAAGSVSTLRYAFRLNDLPIQVVVLAISKAIFPFISEQALHRDYLGLSRVYRHGIVFLAFLTFPITCLMALFSQEAVQILLERGAFDRGATLQTAETLVFYSFGLFFYAYSFVNATFFSALKDTKPLLYVGFLSIVLNFVFNYAFMKVFGVQGIALSTTVTLVIVCTIFVVLLKKRLRAVDLSHVSASFTRLLAASAAMFGVGLGLKNMAQGLGVSVMIYFPAIAGVISLGYLGAVYVMRTGELANCLEVLGAFLKNVKRS